MSRRVVGWGVIGACAFGLAACSTAPGSEDGPGNVLRNLVTYGGTTVPPAAATPVDDVPCPQVDVIEGGAAQITAGGRSQLSLVDFARECRALPDGRVAVKIGVQVRALLGPGGSAGRQEAPLRFVLRGRDEVYASRTVRASVTVPPGEGHASAAIVEDNFIVPAGIGDNFLIEVGLGGRAPSPTASGSRRRG